MEKMVAGNLFWPYTTFANSTLHFNPSKMKIVVTLSDLAGIIISAVILTAIGITWLRFKLKK
jgi:hypothetical protein